MPGLRFSYLYQEDIAQIIDAKIPICLLNNKNILISGDASQLLCSYLLSNLVTLKKFYDLNIGIYIWPNTTEYFGCDCITGINKLSDVKNTVSYIIDTDKRHTRDLINYATRHNARLAFITGLDSSEDVPSGVSHVTVRLGHLLGILPTTKNLVQTTILGIVSDQKILLPDIRVKTVLPEAAAIGILKAVLSDEVKVELISGTVNPNNILLKTPMNGVEDYALEVVKVLSRYKEEESD